MRAEIHSPVNTDPIGVRPTTRLQLAKGSRYKTSLLYPSLNNSFGTWPLSPKYLPTDTSDTYHTVTNGQEFRLDLISYDIYGTATLWWVIALVNEIRNPFVKPKVGDLLRVPQINRLLVLL